MPAVVITLSAAERHRLKKLARSRTMSFQLVVRATIVRLAAAGLSKASIAALMNVTVDTVRKWRGRFAVRRLDGFADLPHSGRPARFTPFWHGRLNRLGLPFSSSTTYWRVTPSSSVCWL